MTYSIDPQLKRVFEKLSVGEFVIDEDDPDEALPGVGRAIKQGLVEKRPGHAWQPQKVFMLTRKGREAAGVKNEASLLRIYGRLSPKCSGDSRPQTRRPS
jgi:hypothetical protein